MTKKKTNLVKYFYNLKWKFKFKFIKIYGLYGVSGSGKSYNSFFVASKHDIQTIIDDGLLIHRGSILAGQSAKKSLTSIGAVKRAIFHYSEHKKNVMQAIYNLKPEKILILGTSKRMITKIIKRLCLPVPVKYIHINEVATKEQQKMARKMRFKENKHIIPVPGIEIKKNFPGGLVDSIEFFFKRKAKNKTSIIEKSVVRTTYNPIGKLTISKKVIYRIIEKILNINFPEIHIVSSKVRYSNKIEDKGIYIKLNISLKYGFNFKQKRQNIQNTLKADLEFLTGLEVHDIFIQINDIFQGK